MTRKKHKPKGYDKLRQGARQYRAAVASGWLRTRVSVQLDGFQAEKLKQIARERGTTLAQELDHAIDAYCLGISRREIWLLNALLDRLNESTARTNRALEAALRETRKTRAHCARRRRTRA